MARLLSPVLVVGEVGITRRAWVARAATAALAEAAAAAAGPEQPRVAGRVGPVVSEAGEKLGFTLGNSCGIIHGLENGYVGIANYESSEQSVSIATDEFSGS
jgi:hypothetical protein